MPWATAGYVESITGKTVTDTQLTQAQGVIDLYSGTTEEAAGDLSARDRKYLKMAVAYQAPWMGAQVDVFTRVNVKSLHQDGVQIVYADEDAPFLAHFARLALSKLSWMGTRSVSLRLPGDVDPDALAALRGDTRVVDRDGERWSPL